MESKTYELLEKLYLEMQGMKGEMQEIKETMATKKELHEVKKTMATKEELQELKNEVYEIKEAMATKEDLNLLAEELHTEIQGVHDEVKEFRHDFNIVEIITTKNAHDIAKFRAVK